jgi:hypothetical protein
MLRFMSFFKKTEKWKGAKRAGGCSCTQPHFFVLASFLPFPKSQTRSSAIIPGRPRSNPSTKNCNKSNTKTRKPNNKIFNSSIMPTSNHLYAPRFLMLPVSPARSTDSQQDASCHSKHSTSHSAEEYRITEATRILSSAPSLCWTATTDASGDDDDDEDELPLIFRPTGWLTSPSLSTTSGDGAPPPMPSFWMIQRSYAFDEDDDDDASL